MMQYLTTHDTVTPDVSAAFQLLTRGVNTNLFKPQARCHDLRDEWDADAHTPVALYVGSLHCAVNIGLIERAFSTFLQTQPGGRCVVIGTGPLIAELRARHPSWSFCGDLYDHVLARHFASADVFIDPSMNDENHAVLESLASGLVTVAYESGFAREHVCDGVDGLLAPLGDVEVFLQRVSEGALRWRDRSLRESARLKARTMTMCLHEMPIHLKPVAMPAPIAA
jgi:glycosyltransferase involved in cell wall biosynthesis